MNPPRVAFIVCLASIAIGTVMHFWILVRLRKANVSVRYFGSILDASKAYRDYAIIAPRMGWDRWPLYLMQLGVYGGLLGAVLVLACDRSLLGEIRRFAEQLK